MKTIKNLEGEDVFGKVQQGLKFCCEVQILSLMCWEVKRGEEMKFQILSTRLANFDQERRKS